MNTPPSKQCLSCKETKPHGSFYKSQSRSGLASYCKACSLSKQRAWVKGLRSSPERLAAHMNKKRAANARWLVNNKRRQSVEGRNKWKRNNPLKVKAHNVIMDLIRSGRLIKPSVCSQCFQPSRIEAHHEDYNKPKIVTWLCKACHTQKHHQYLS